MSEQLNETENQNEILYSDVSDDTVLCDNYGLPFEPCDEFSEDPLGFEELTETLWKDLTETYDLARRYNKQSPHYLKLCAHLEKNIKYMGSLCVTKAVLEQNGLCFPGIYHISIEGLYSIVSLNFRKCHAAFRELIDNKKGFDMNLLDWVCRWAALAGRLKATAEKIQKIRTGKINAESLLEREKVFSGSSRNRETGLNNHRLSGPGSLPILGSYARELVKERKKYAAAEKRKKALEERKKKMTGPYRGYRINEFYKPVPVDDPVKFSEFLRKEMIDEAKYQNDEAAVDILKKETPEEILARWHGSHGEVSGSVPPKVPIRPGPSDETRKKLRELRKKKKKR